MRSDLSYLHEKLGQAIRTALFNQGPREMAAVFEVLNRGIYHRKQAGNPKPLSNQAQQWFDRISELITPSTADAADPSASQDGTYQVLARRMTPGERSELGGLMMELYSWIEDT
jgi:hypothetical protein